MYKVSGRKGAKPLTPPLEVLKEVLRKCQTEGCFSCEKKRLTSPTNKTESFVKMLEKCCADITY